MKKKRYPVKITSIFLKFSTLRHTVAHLTLTVVLVLIVSCYQNNIFAQDSSHIRVSLLTCTPGNDLDETFGHSAIRITDSTTTTDIVFNYGTFNFEDPGFYTKFIRGKLMYYVSVDNFSDFVDNYKTANRGITEQLLNLNAAEKIGIEQFLYKNAREENKFYKYDFFLDNCTTRLRDIIINFKSSHPVLNPVMPANTRFRQAIHQYLDMNGKAWSKLGIDLLLGAPTDAIMTTKQTEFLPDNLMKALDSTNQQHQLVTSKSQLFPYVVNGNKQSLFTPSIIFSLLLVTIILLSFSDNKKVVSFLHGFDGLLFFLTGALGILFVFMWTCTDHSMVKNNFNLIWAWPTHVVSAFFINSKKNWVKKYFIVTIAGLIIVLLSWFFLPQQMNNALLPIVLLLLYRSIIKYQAF